MILFYVRGSKGSTQSMSIQICNLHHSPWITFSIPQWFSSRFCDFVLSRIVASQSICFFKPHVKRQSYRHNLQCIVIVAWDRAWVVGEARIIEFSWYQPNVEILTISKFLLSNQANGGVLKVTIWIRHKSFARSAFAPRHLVFTIEDNAIVVAR